MIGMIRAGSVIVLCLSKSICRFCRYRRIRDFVNFSQRLSGKPNNYLNFKCNDLVFWSLSFQMPHFVVSILLWASKNLEAQKGQSFSSLKLSKISRITSGLREDIYQASIISMEFPIMKVNSLRAFRVTLFQVKSNNCIAVTMEQMRFYGSSTQIHTKSPRVISVARLCKDAVACCTFIQWYAEELCYFTGFFIWTSIYFNFTSISLQYDEAGLRYSLRMWAAPLMKFKNQE